MTIWQIKVKSSEVGFHYPERWRWSVSRRGKPRPEEAQVLFFDKLVGQPEGGEMKLTP